MGGDNAHGHSDTCLCGYVLIQHEDLVKFHLLGPRGAVRALRPSVVHPDAIIIIIKLANHLGTSAFLERPGHRVIPTDSPVFDPRRSLGCICSSSAPFYPLTDLDDVHYM